MRFRWFSALFAVLVGGLLADAQEPFRWNAIESTSETTQEPLGVILSGLSQAVPTKDATDLRPVQWLYFKSATCLPCRAAERDFRDWFTRSNWQISPDQDAQIREITDGDPLILQFGVTSYPTFVLLKHGLEVRRHVRYPGRDVLAAEFNTVAAEHLEETKARPTTGLAIGTIQARDQIQSLLAQLKPVIDGGTLDVTYSAPPGVVKQWLIISQNGSGIKLPPRLTARLAIESDTLVVSFPGTAPQIFASGFTRQVQQVEISTSKVSIRLPWMIDPEWQVR
jgi:hypothetical protein